jgi:hypothetical protein
MTRPGTARIRIIAPPAEARAALACLAAVFDLASAAEDRSCRDSADRRIYLTVSLKTQGGASAQPPSNPLAPLHHLKGGTPIMTPDQLAGELTAQLHEPHSDQATAGAARLAAETARFLNYATGPHSAEGLTDPATAYAVLGDLAAAARRLPQLLGQVTDFLDHARAAGHLADDHGRLPIVITANARAELAAAAGAAADLARKLGSAQSIISGLHLTGGEDR